MPTTIPPLSADLARRIVVTAYVAEAEELQGQLDRLAALAARSCGTKIGLVSLVESERQRFVGRSGIAVQQTPREQSFCAHAMLIDGGLIIPDAATDSRFRDNPLVTGAPFIRFYAGYPLVSAQGVPLGSLCVIDDAPRTGLTGDEQETLAVLADAVMALLERARIEKSSDRDLARSQTERADLEQRFQVLTDVMPQLVWSAKPSGLVDYFNRVWCDFVGQPQEASFGTQWIDFVHADDRDSAVAAWHNAVAGSIDYEVEYRLRRNDGQYRWVLARGLPIRDDDGSIRRWIGTCTDIHEQKMAADLLELLSRELNHRIKNIFAVIGGLIALTFRNRPELKDHAAALRDRVLALGRAHDFVRTGGGAPTVHQHGSLSGLLRTLLAPYQDDESPRIVMRGDEVAIDDRSATPLALFFHELATNAAKFGALGDNGGQIEIGIADGAEVKLVWRETGGPVVKAPSTQGFGSTLVEMSIVRQLGGTVDYEWRPDGLAVTARIPKTSLAR